MNFSSAEILTPDFIEKVELPLMLSRVAAGFPSPADDYIDKKMDLNEHLISNPAATFFVRSSGESMRDAGIAPEDVLIVDRSLDPAPNSIVIAAVNGELTVKRLKYRNNRIWLAPENPEYPLLEITEDTSFEIWGVVTYIIHKAGL